MNASGAYGGGYAEMGGGDMAAMLQRAVAERDHFQSQAATLSANYGRLKEYTTNAVDRIKDLETQNHHLRDEVNRLREQLARFDAELRSANSRADAATKAAAAATAAAVAAPPHRAEWGRPGDSVVGRFAGGFSLGGVGNGMNGSNGVGSAELARDDVSGREFGSAGEVERRRDSSVGSAALAGDSLPERSQSDTVGLPGVSASRATAVSAAPASVSAAPPAPVASVAPTVSEAAPAAVSQAAPAAAAPSKPLSFRDAAASRASPAAVAARGGAPRRVAATPASPPVVPVGAAGGSVSARRRAGSGVGGGNSGGRDGFPAGGGNKSVRCRNCQKTGHIMKNCPLIQCYKCKSNGHMASSCPSG